jgi:hypothetical protein
MSAARRVKGALGDAARDLIASSVVPNGIRLSC